MLLVHFDSSLTCMIFEGETRGQDYRRVGQRQDDMVRFAKALYSLAILSKIQNLEK